MRFQPKYRDDEHRIRAKVQIDAETGCWVWQGEIQGRGYGRVYRGPGLTPRYALAHRFSYELFVGPIPEGLVIDHLCRNKPCVNPEHLEPVTSRTNLLRSPITPAAVNAAKTECVHGHAFDEANTGLTGGRRYCRTCSRAIEHVSRARRNARRKEAA